VTLSTALKPPDSILE